MYYIKGFVEFPNFVNNAPYEIAPYGEISTYGLTFSRDQTKYVHPSFGDVEFQCFFAENNGNRVGVPNEFSNHILAISKHIFNKTTSGVLQPDDGLFIQEMFEAFGNTMEDIDVGEWVTYSGKSIPSSITWTMNSETSGDNRISIWFSNDSFVSTYDEYEYKVVLPYGNMDIFLKTHDEVVNYLEGRGFEEAMDEINQYSTESPYSRMVPVTYEWIDSRDPSRTMDLTFYVLIHGQAGYNVDNIKRAVQQAILDASTYPRGKWLDVFPDIFRNNEFIMIPMWNNLLVKDTGLKIPTYGSVADINQAVSLAETFCPFYETEHVMDHMELITTTYRFIPAVVVAGDSNKIADALFKNIHKDYVPVGSTSNEFGKMSPETRLFVLKLNEVMALAYEQDQGSVLPTEFTRIERNGMKFISFNPENGREYLVLTRPTFTEFMGGE